MGDEKVNEKSRLFKLCGSTTRNLNPALKTQPKLKVIHFFFRIFKKTNKQTVTMKTHPALHPAREALKPRPRVLKL